MASKFLRRISLLLLIYHAKYSRELIFCTRRRKIKLMACMWRRRKTRSRGICRLAL
uniref:Uncharacterized protein n=1 Tax=Arundo donax TaxID=35708 RepID=A0A0A8Y5T6_ARUDO